MKYEAVRICSAMLDDMSSQILTEAEKLKRTNPEKSELVKRKNEIGVKMAAISCECSSEEALNKRTYKNSNHLKNEIYRFSSECKYKGIEESGFIELHRSNLIKACYFKGSLAANLMIASFGDLWLVKSQDYDIQTLEKAYPAQAEKCACFSEAVSKIPAKELWHDKQVSSSSRVNIALKSCGI
ncbi:hypothetical protein ACJJIE_11390 [Microbulbifer sp. TRSA001]|uniref:hypothetical protein n=1 Tax=Microbulbifer sp. TRSA001 TaxID=3243381 RepID=UPI004039AFC2